MKSSTTEKQKKKAKEAFADNTTPTLRRVLGDTDFSVVVMDLNDLFRKAMDDESVTLDVGGHFRSGNSEHLHHYTREYIQNKLDYFVFRDTDPDKVQHLIDVLNGKKEPDIWVPMHTSRSFRCSECGEPVALEFNGKEIHCTNPCPYPEGQVYEFELNVPSGKMVVANDLRNWWKIVGDYDVNNTMGCRKTAEKYAEVGMAHAFVSNTCPAMYKANDGKFLIGVGSRSLVKGKRPVASICTDLWWYSIVDHDDFVRRKVDLDESYYDVVKCKPGVYRFRHLWHTCDHDDCRNPQIYTEIEWVREPDPVKDHEADYKTLDFTAGQIIKDCMKWEFTKSKNKVDSIQRAADQVMCVCCNGYDYHPNGWLGHNPDLTKDSPSVEIPVFKKKYHWYPLYKDSFIVQAAGVGNEPHWRTGLRPKDLKLNESFTALAFNILHCIVKYGVDDHGYGHVKETLKWANKALKSLVKKYPDRVPAYVKRYLKSESK